jgi:beta-lactamase class A
MLVTRRQWVLVSAAGLRSAAADTLAAQWRKIAADTDGTVGAAALHLGSGRHLSLNGDDHFPMASVCKLPIAMHMLALVDEGKFSRQSMIEVIAPDVTLEVSEVGHRWPKQKQFPLDELVALMVARSDNTAVETLYRVGGGSPALMARLRAWHIEGIRLDRRRFREEPAAIPLRSARYGHTRCHGRPARAALSGRTLVGGIHGATGADSGNHQHGPRAY